MREFSVSYDSLTKIVSLAVVALVAAIPFLAGQWWILGPSAALILATYGYSPLGYSVSGRVVRVRRLFGTAEIPLEALTAARRVTPEDLKMTLRLFGSGGLFGYFGKFRTSKLGVCTWYCTRRDSMALIASAAGTSLFSPDDTEGFLAAIRAEAPLIPADGGAQAPIAKQGGFNAYVWIGGAIALLSVGIGYLAFTYSPGPPKLQLGDTSLTIGDRFYPVTLQRDSVDLARARVVAVDDPEWRPVRRTNGFANNHYRSGWFRTVSGQSVRLYLADAKKLVLLPGKETVLVEVSNPEEFLESLRSRWR